MRSAPNIPKKLNEATGRMALVIDGRVHFEKVITCSTMKKDTLRNWFTYAKPLIGKGKKIHIDILHK